MTVALHSRWRSDLDAVNVGALLWIVAINSAPAAVFVGFAQDAFKW